MTVFVLYVDSYYLDDLFENDTVLGVYSSIDKAKAMFDKTCPKVKEHTHWVDHQDGGSILYENDYNSEYGAYIDAVKMDDMY